MCVCVCGNVTVCTNKQILLVRIYNVIGNMTFNNITATKQHPLSAIRTSTVFLLNYRAQVTLKWGAYRRPACLVILGRVVSLAFTRTL